MRGENQKTHWKTSKNSVENQQTRSTYDSGSGHWNPCHIGGRRVLSPLRQPCFLWSMVSASNHWLRSNKTYKLCFSGSYYSINHWLALTILQATRSRSSWLCSIKGPDKTTNKPFQIYNSAFGQRGYKKLISNAVKLYNSCVCFGHNAGGTMKQRPAFISRWKLMKHWVNKHTVFN